MAGRKEAAPAVRPRGAPRVVAPRNKVNVVLPFARFSAADPAPMRAGDWISLAGLVISVAGFSVVIWQSVRTARASQVDQAIR